MIPRCTRLSPDRDCEGGVIARGVRLQADRQGYDRFGGIQGDTAALCNVLRHAGITSTQTGAPYTETMINGLCGGPGFLYAVFEYKGWPPLMSLALRSRSMNDMYVSDGLPRLGARVRTSETTSAGAARKALDSALSAGRAPLCVADVASLPWYGLPSEFVGGAPQVIAVAGRDEEAVWVDDRSTRPIRMDLDQLAKARSSYRDAKHRLITIEGPEKSHDATSAMREAIAMIAGASSSPPCRSRSGSIVGFQASRNGGRCSPIRRTARAGLRARFVCRLPRRSCRGARRTAVEKGRGGVPR